MSIKNDQKIDRVLIEQAVAGTDVCSECLRLEKLSGYSTYYISIRSGLNVSEIAQPNWEQHATLIEDEEKRRRVNPLEDVLERIEIYRNLGEIINRSGNQMSKALAELKARNISRKTFDRLLKIFNEGITFFYLQSEKAWHVDHGTQGFYHLFQFSTNEGEFWVCYRNHCTLHID